MIKEYPGYFVTLEGPEGSGKTSHIPKLVEHLRSLGLKVFPTREPGGTNIGEQIRAVIHDTKNDEMHSRTETLLYQAARAQIVEEVIKPHLEIGEVVLSDRYLDSTIAYQGYGREQDIQKIRSLVEYASAGLIPNFTIFIDIDPTVGLKRKKNENEWNRMDNQTVDFHKRVYNGYHQIINEDMKKRENGACRFVCVDGSQSIEEVLVNLKIALEVRLQQKGLI